MLLAELEELGIKVRMQLVVCTSEYMKYTAAGPGSHSRMLYALQIGMVVDLTNSSRYYTADADGTSDFRYPGPDPPAVYHRKVRVGIISGNAFLCAAAFQHLCKSSWHADPVQRERSSASA